MLPAGYPPQLLFSSRPDAVVHFPRSFVALLPFCLSAFPVRAPHSLPPVSQLFPSARAQPFSGFSTFPVRTPHSLPPVSQLFPSGWPSPFPVFRSDSLTSIKKAPRREPKIKTLLKIARIRRILQKVSEFSV